MAFDGSLNVAGVGGDLHLIFDRPESTRSELEWVRSHSGQKVLALLAAHVLARPEKNVH